MSGFAYVTLFSDGKMRPSVVAAVEFVRRRHPGAHFGRWEQARRARHFPVWPNVGAQLHFEMGDKTDDNRPVANVRVQERELRPRAEA